VDNIRLKVPVTPAAFFGMVLGLAGFGSAWCAAHRVWQLPKVVGEAIMLAATIVCVLLVILYALKWMVAMIDPASREHLLAGELLHGIEVEANRFLRVHRVPRPRSYPLRPRF
jgi:hypothetical protein